MAGNSRKNVLILGANSDVAKQAILLYVQRGYFIMAASRSTGKLEAFVLEHGLTSEQVAVSYFDAVAYATHAEFYQSLPAKPHIVLYAAGFQVENTQALVDWEGTFQMMQVHYCGAVSILNLIVADSNNTGLEQIVGLSSLSGVRGRKSNFIYGSGKSAFTQYLTGMRQHLYPRKIRVNVIVAGYIRSKMTAGLDLPESLLMEPAFIARAVVGAKSRLIIVPGWKWKIIYQVLRLMPERLVAKLP